MKKQATITYDGTFDGFLTAVFTVYEQQLKVAAFHRQTEGTGDLFAASEEIHTNFTKAERVAKGLLKKISGKAMKHFYCAFLSELPKIEMHLLEYVHYIFENDAKTETDFSHPAILKITQTAKMVNREKHRMEAFVRFKLTTDDIFFAQIEPDFDVLPLIQPHFASRYADQKWVIYDINRKRGLFYDLECTRYIHLEFYEYDNFSMQKSSYFTENESEFEELWKNYFKSTNIISRKNNKLHLQHLPSRYWKYLSEKWPLLK